MKTAFLDLNPDTQRVSVTFDGRPLLLRQGGNLAAELLAAGVTTFRLTPVSGAPRAPFCMMGTCFDCLVEIDGITRQACLLDVTEGLNVTMPKGRGDA